MQIKATVSTNIPADPDRKTRAAIKEASIAGAQTHHDRHMPRHFEGFAIPKYGYPKRSKAYDKLKQKLGLPLNPLVFSGKTKSEIMTSYQIKATGTRGASLHMKASLLGATTGRVLDVEAINRLLAAGRGAHEDARLMRLLQRLKKSGGKMTYGQQQAVARNAELTAISSDEINWIAKTEEEVFAEQIKTREPIRKL